MSIFERYPRIPGPRRDVGEIIPGLYQHSLTTTSVFVIATRSHYDESEVEIALVDAGWKTHSANILAYLSSLGYGPESVTSLIATHYHLDHIGGMRGLQEATGVDVCSHHVEADNLRQNRKGDIPNPFQQWWLKALSWPIMARMHPPPVDSVTPLDEGDTLPLLSGARVIHTPGHTPGSISLHFPDDGVLIAADALQRRGDRLIEPSKFFTSDMPAARESIRKMASLDFEVLCLSHFQPMRKGARAALRSLAEYVS